VQRSEIQLCVLALRRPLRMPGPNDVYASKLCIQLWILFCKIIPFCFYFDTVFTFCSCVSTGMNEFVRNALEFIYVQIYKYTVKSVKLEMHFNGVAYACLFRAVWALESVDSATLA